MKKLFFYLVLFICVHFHAHSQNNCCANIGFDATNFTHWNAFTGTAIVQNNNWIPGLDSAMNVPQADVHQHVLNTVTSIDPFCNSNPCMTTTLPGGGTSVRIGNSLDGCHAASLNYTMTVDSCNNGLLYSYAIVLQDPGHSPSDQPRFDVSISDTLGNIIGGNCGFYSVYAGSDPTFQQGTNDVLYKCWTSVCVDMRTFIGQKIVVSFMAQDCGLCGHFGYAYVDAQCISLESRATFCPAVSNLIKLMAPSNFSSYQWYTPNGQPITTPGGTNDTCFYTGQFYPGDTFVVALGSIPGCFTYMNVVLEEQKIHMENALTTGLCPGDTTTIMEAVEDGFPNYIFTAYNADNHDVIAADTVPIGVFQLTVTDGSYIITVSDSAGCRTSDTLLIKHPEFDTLPGFAYFCNGDSVAVFKPDSSPEIHAPYQWLSYPDGNALTGKTNDSLLVSYPLQGQQYFVTWHDNNNCLRRSLITSQFKAPEPLFNPDSTVNIFTPDGNGKNDTFLPYLSSLFSPESIQYYAEEFQLKIFDRWGKRVFSSENYLRQWDGTFKNTKCSEGVYYWIATYKNRCSGENFTPVTQSGFVHLMD